jgi:hypothetical protein
MRGRAPVRRWARALAPVLATLLLATAGPVFAEPDTITVYRSPTCGCCTKWEKHLESHGFRVKSVVVPDVTPVKIENGISRRLASCHTAFIGGYVVEGHVPAEDVKRLLKEKPAISGLAVPRMPIGSPGMEGPNPVVYDVLAFDRGGRVEVFSTHRP